MNLTSARRTTRIVKAAAACHRNSYQRDGQKSKHAHFST